MNELIEFVRAHSVEWWVDDAGVVRILEHGRLPDYSWQTTIFTVASIAEARFALGY